MTAVEQPDSSRRDSVLLGTVAIEPTRWAHLTPASEPTVAPEPIVLADWMDAIAEAGFDGIEVWEPHLPDPPTPAVDRVLAHHLPVDVWNSYVSLDEPSLAEREHVGRRAVDAGAWGIKYNVGNDVTQVDEYAERIAEWLTTLPSSIRLLCECHHGISIAETPSVAAAIFERAGPGDRVQAIVHTHESDDQLRERFDAYGDRITHVHVNHLDFSTMTTPALSEIEERFAVRVDLLRSLGFRGTWTIEFCRGLLTADDRPDRLVAQAADDLAVIRRVLGSGDEK